MTYSTVGTLISAVPTSHATVLSKDRGVRTNVRQSRRCCACSSAGGPVLPRARTCNHPMRLPAAAKQTTVGALPIELIPEVEIPWARCG